MKKEIQSETPAKKRRRNKALKFIEAVATLNNLMNNEAIRTKVIDYIMEKRDSNVNSMLNQTITLKKIIEQQVNIHFN